ncbi:MAG: membrane protein insertion efficiency factor YidD [Deltaproteobacteria bacterium]|nr:membrane protein insertion efficiency factor YidD [Deltaproteobacteria bacterium]
MDAAAQSPTWSGNSSRASSGWAWAARRALRIPALTAVFFVKAYQYALSPFLPSACRYHPTCSEYTVQALRRYGFFKGLYLGIRRILRCHPWHPGGYDPVP